VSTEDTKLALIQKLEKRIRAQRFALRQNWAWLSSHQLSRGTMLWLLKTNRDQRDEIKVLKEQRDEYQQEAQVEAAERRRLYDETTLLRAALATSKDPCLYCQLPADEMAKCRSGFPGCARMDDLTWCPEFGAMMNEHDLREQLAEVEKQLSEADHSAMKLHDMLCAAQKERDEARAALKKAQYQILAGHFTREVLAGIEAALSPETKDQA
jgi:hypothetical protein